MGASAAPGSWSGAWLQQLLITSMNGLMESSPLFYLDASFESILELGPSVLESILEALLDGMDETTAPVRVAQTS